MTVSAVCDFEYWRDRATTPRDRSLSRPIQREGVWLSGDESWSYYIHEIKNAGKGGYWKSLGKSYLNQTLIDFTSLCDLRLEEWIVCF